VCVCVRARPVICDELSSFHPLLPLFEAERLTLHAQLEMREYCLSVRAIDVPSCLLSALLHSPGRALSCAYE
jgi:hypothetical protein